MLGVAMVMPIVSRQLLPQFDGPKLHPFSDGDSDVQFVRLLSDNEKVGHSHVFEVIIKSQYYALKVVSLAVLL